MKRSEKDLAKKVLEKNLTNDDPAKREVVVWKEDPEQAGEDPSNPPETEAFFRERGFEVVLEHKGSGISIPTRKTAQSAGYDLAAAEDVHIPPRWSGIVPTGVKAFMPKDEFLQVSVRSSLAFKRGLFLVNGVGIIDADYYNNPDNEGHILVGLYNSRDEAAYIKKGERVAQGIFLKYGIVDGDDATDQRNGGVGSTG